MADSYSKLTPDHDPSGDQPIGRDDTSNHTPLAGEIESRIDRSSDASRENLQQAEEPTEEGAKEDERDVSDASSESSIDEDEPENIRKRVERNPKRIRGFSNYLNLLEARMMAIEKKVLPAPPPEEETPPDVPKHEASIPELRLMKWTEFKHKYADDKSTYAIEVLIGAPKFWLDRVKEERLHYNLNVKQLLYTPDQPTPVTQTDLDAQDDMPERIRINSIPIMAILNRLAEENVDNAPRVFLRPYKKIVYFEKQIRQHLDDLRSKWLRPFLGSSDTATVAPEEPPRPEEGQARLAADAAMERNSNLINSAEAMNDLQCLVDFMDKFIKPYLDRFDGITNGKIRFQDLWHLFKPEDTVFMPVKIAKQKVEKTSQGEARPFGMFNSTLAKGNERYQNAYKVMSVVGGRPELRSREEGEERTIEKPFYTCFEMGLYSVDFDGKEFIPNNFVHLQHHFDGERDITSLAVYPWRFAENGNKISEQLVQRGRDFTNYTSNQHRFYAGTTLVKTPNGFDLLDPSPGNPEHVEGDVIVDFHQAFQSHPSWRPWSSWNEIDPDDDEFQEAYDTIVWADREHKNLRLSYSDVIDQDWLIERRRTDNYLKSVPLFKLKPSEEGEQYDGTKLADDLLMFLPERVFGYNLLDRKFSMLSIEDLRPVPDKQDGFDSLKLAGDTKGMVRALVSAHFMKMKTINVTYNGTVDYDIVRGKGRGLILLLHGVPGVGKTSTAETVAQSLGKPLLPIVCGDLGTTPENVEKALSEIFRLAQHWDCVLLLDEADVFLAQRTERDLEQNALVSVFLRKLEWFSGILFLTTNRVGVIDEAFKSRIHMTLYYPALTLEQTVDIWKMNLERIRRIDEARIQGTDDPPMIIDESQIMDYAKTHFDYSQTRHGRWNGRQIRNAFQTATALALHRAQEENAKRKTSRPPLPYVAPRLKRKDFKIVAKATYQFDEYMSEVAGVSAHLGDIHFAG
ncbi:hypothetical protein SLS57_011117 [Botryosphaeria dothidea]